MHHFVVTPRPTALPTSRGTRARRLAAVLLLLALSACNASAPSMLLTVDDPSELLPTQLRVSISFANGDTTVVTRPGAPGAPLTPGQTLRLLLPDDAVGTHVDISVEALLEEAVVGLAIGSFPVKSEELEIRMALVGTDEECSESNCPDGCCAGRRCLPNALDACGAGGAACSSCVPDRADLCLAGACRCGTDEQCSSGYRCVEGSCQPREDVSCTGDQDCTTPPGQCYAETGTCTAGTCTYAPKVQDTPCNDGNACTRGDACDGAGVCGSSPTICDAPPTPCSVEVGTCSPLTGACEYAPRPANSPCNDGNACTMGDVCNASGTCSGTPLVCDTPPNAQCYVAGSGACVEGTCAYTMKASGTTCDDGNACTLGETCQASGSCGGGASRLCLSPPSACHDTGTCHASAGCFYPQRADGSPCNSAFTSCSTGTCQAGTCSNFTNPCGPGMSCCESQGGTGYTCHISPPMDQLCTMVP